MGTFSLGGAVVGVALLFSPALPAEAQAAGLKPALRGLIDMGDISFHREDGGVAKTSVSDLDKYQGIFGGIVINITWAQLEPARGSLVTDGIDGPLNDIRAYNEKNPDHPIGARLRVWPGPCAPDWAKHLGGDPVKILHRDMPVTVGRFWAKPYREAWRDFQNRLAAKYDSEPLIREVSNTTGSSITDESMLLPGDAMSIGDLKAAGFTDQEYQDCLNAAPEDYAGWKTTGIEFTFSPYRLIDSGHPVLAMDVTTGRMDSVRKALGAQAVLSHHALQGPIPANFASMYAEMKKLGPPITLQTHAPKGLNLPAALQAGIETGAISIELWSEAQFGGFISLPPEKVKELAALFPAK
jgi:hypothetical protein